MNIFYNLIIYLGQFFSILASPFSRKVKEWRNGRKGLFERIAKEIDNSKKHVWFHFASLGEFEQGRPVLEGFKERYPNKDIIVTFFSPSGYEIRKNYSEAKHVFYLPADTHSNAKRFVQLINPELVFFTKYEFWYNYFKQIKAHGAPLYLISAIFRPSQFFFKWYGVFYRPTLRLVDHYFVQNQESGQLLQKIGINRVSLTGDTRFDRVAGLSATERKLPIIDEFAGGSKLLVAGSTWQPDEELLMSFRQVYPEWKIILAPHQITPRHIKEIAARFSDHILYSVWSAYVRPIEGLGKVYDRSSADLTSSEICDHKFDETKFAVDGANKKKQLEACDPNVLIIDNIGMLSSIYAYADVAYIGGGFGEGIHNVLEAATYGVPVVFGPNYHKFQEAKDLIHSKAAFSVSTLQDLVDAFDYLQHDENLKEIGRRASGYVQQQAGATEKILSFLADNYRGNNGQ